MPPGASQDEGTPPIILLENGDSVHVSGNDITVNDLSGRGAVKTNILKSLDRYWDSLGFKASTSPDAAYASGVAKVLNSSREMLKVAARLLWSCRNSVDAQSLKMLRAYAQGAIWDVYNGIYWFFNVSYTPSQKDSVQNILKNNWLPLRKRYKAPVDENTALSDLYYARNLLKDYSLLQIIKNQDFNMLSDNWGLREKYLYFKSHYHGIIREKILTLLLLSAPRSNDISYCYDDASKIVGNKDFRRALDAHCQCIPGTQAYNFTLLDSNRNPHALKDFRGKVIVLDFWFTGCGNCRELAPKLKEVEERFADDPRVQFISISSDRDMETWKKSIRSGLYTSSPKEINLYTGGRRTEDPIYESTNTYSAPTLKLIDARGKWCENPLDCRQDDGRDLTDKIKKALKAIDDKAFSSVKMPSLRDGL